MGLLNKERKHFTFTGHGQKKNSWVSTHTNRDQNGQAVNTIKDILVLDQ